MARNRRREKSRRQPKAQAQKAPVTPGDEGTEPGAYLHPDAELAHIAPDVELAEAQMALGRPELAEVPSAEELELYEEEQAGRGPAAGGLSTGGRRRREPQDPHPVPAQHRQPLPLQLVGFLRGSWAELQRVQWPDRRQVFQATGVVLGFVIVAGAFLGVADLVASKLVNLLIK